MAEGGGTWQRQQGSSLLKQATYTVLFTDIVGSTEQRTRLGDDAGDALRREHDSIVRRAVKAHGGEVVKGTGDGALAAFLGAADAVSCAVVIQQSLERRNRRALEHLGLRIGISLGDTCSENGDIYGTAVNEAARICGRADEGQILCADVVRAVAGSRAREEFEPLGTLELKGLPDPIAVSEVQWMPSAVEKEEGPPIPPGLERGTRLEFVGRASEFEELQTRWKRAAVGEPGAVLLAGEPGVGKTRLAIELAYSAREDAVVLFGRCDDEIGVPYQPFVEALTFWLDHLLDDEGEEGLGRYAGELIRLVPDLAERVPHLPSPLSSDPETEQYRLFDAVAAWLRAASLNRPVLLVLDDIHWAAKPTLHMLRHVARASEGNFLVVATYRDTDLDRSHPLQSVLADLRRIPDVERVSLAGLDEAEVAELLAVAAGHTLDDPGIALARAIHAETEGNPFFVGEVLRHLAESGAIFEHDGRWTASVDIAELGIPEGVREVIGRRLDRLSETANDALAHASVVGREFDLGLLGRLTDRSEDELMEVLDDGVNARVIRETGIGRYTFSHALVRSTLYDELRPTRRARLHRRVAETIESGGNGSIETHLGELAHHFGRAGEVDKTIEYACRAGDYALTQLAHEEAASYFDHARELLEDLDPEPARLGELLLRLGTAQRRAGEPGFRETLLEAAALAERAGDTELVAQAALANNRGFFSTLGDADAERVSVIRRALDAIGDVERPERARLLANLMMEVTFDEPMERRRALFDDAVSLARRVGDEPTLAHVLIAGLMALWEPGTLEERLALSEELVRVTDLLGDPYLQLFAAYYRFAPCVEAARSAEAEDALARMTCMTTEVGQATPSWLNLFARAGHAVLHGDDDAAEELAEQQLELGQRIGFAEEAVFFYGVVMWVMRLEQGRVDEVIDVARLGAEQYRHMGIDAMLGITLCALGKDDEARELLDTAVPVDGMLRHQVWSSVVWGRAVMAVHLRDEVRAAELYDALEPFSDQLIYNGLVVLDSAASILGELATVLGRPDDAARHFDTAIDLATRMNAPRLLARAQSRRQELERVEV